MFSYLTGWAMGLLIWLHVIAAIAWIGESFYFVMLDNSLHEPEEEAERRKGVFGELWAVHGGGFYHSQKYLVSPARMPDDLHWSKWKSYATWLSGFALLTVMYLMQPGTYLIDPSVAHLTPSLAIICVLGFLLAGWVVYDIACRLLGKNDFVLGVVIAIFVAAAAFLATHLFAPQAAFLIVGAMIGTIMSANVFFWIIPGQKKMVNALARGETPDPIPGKRAKQRSVHNTYFTLPVVFAMLSSHFSMLYGGAANWLSLWLVMVAGALIRQYFVMRHTKSEIWQLPTMAAGLIVIVMVLVAPAHLIGGAVHAQTAAANAPGPTVDTAAVTPIIQDRCGKCHSAHPTMMSSAPDGLIFDTASEIHQHAALIYQQAVQAKSMPPGNITHITKAERAKIGRWFQGGAK
ncbi:urate hydroxylase PuuD [Acidiphilium sp. AL]|uniref:Urate hydroxylase PuuD n=1 Tax=Acidiphilium iwatense TaxID=768198 RepID=A0ABS9DY38_9PROT|nr:MULTISPECIES: urate hydroxylase PuuD [Acidiphilium]MCF3947589.1 urate hydroxylase PuuD [Acidiphilium iwatense]MCU4160755.1 urate hydroxylase PuuD [Acidiphilium sp. AL]